MIRLQWNPLTLVDHNQWTRFPRVFFHAAHIALGLVVFWLAQLVHAPAISVALGALLVECATRCTWIDWHRTSGRLFHFFGLRVDDGPDFWSDLGLTLLGAFVGVAFASPLGCFGWLASYYVLSTFNGT